MNKHNKTCVGAHCRCMNLNNSCPNFHHGDHNCPFEKKATNDFQTDIFTMPDGVKFTWEERMKRGVNYPFGEFVEKYEEGFWLIWSLEHEGWWGPNHNGYLKERRSAGLYSFDEALKIVKDANIGLHEIPNEAMIKYEL